MPTPSTTGDQTETARIPCMRNARCDCERRTQPRSRTRTGSEGHGAALASESRGAWWPSSRSPAPEPPTPTPDRRGGGRYLTAIGRPHIARSSRLQASDLGRQRDSLLRLPVHGRNPRAAIPPIPAPSNIKVPGSGTGAGVGSDPDRARSSPMSKSPPTPKNWLGPDDAD